MPPKKYVKRYGGRNHYGKKEGINAKVKAAVKKELTVELPKKILNVQVFDALQSTEGIIYDLTVVQQGDGINQRIGDDITLGYMQLTLHCQQHASTPSVSNALRIVVFQTKARLINTTSLFPNTVLEVVTLNLMNVFQYKSVVNGPMIRILHDKHVELHKDGVNSRTLHLNVAKKKMMPKTQYADDTTTIDKTGGLYMLVLSNNLSAASFAPSVSFQMRLHYSG